MTVQITTKSVVSVAEMSRMCGLSRARFYQLVNQQYMPQPLYDVATRRPFFNEELQKVCLEVRRRNCGVNGKPILFYAARHPLGAQSKPVRKQKVEPKQKNEYADLIDGLRALGLESVTAAQVDAAVKELFPAGVHQKNSAEVVRAVFLRLMRRNS